MFSPNCCWRDLFRRRRSGSRLKLIIFLLSLPFVRLEGQTGFHQLFSTIFERLKFLKHILNSKSYVPFNYTNFSTSYCKQPSCSKNVAHIRLKNLLSTSNNMFCYSPSRRGVIYVSMNAAMTKSVTDMIARITVSFIPCFNFE